MRTLISLLAFTSTSLFAGILPGKSLPPSKHIIVKEYPQDDLDAGTCKILGHVYYGHSKDSPLQNVLVSSLDKKSFDHTNTKGYYEFSMNSIDTALFAFKSELQEHVIWSIDLKERYVYEIDFYLVEDYENMIMDKPVIYMYSDTEQKVEIEIDPKGEFTFTYPEYKDSWEVSVSGNQLICENRTYPYLFWEASTLSLDYDENKMIYGQLIETKHAVQFLEISLSKLGLNFTEQADFITYWVPKLQRKKFAFIQFMVDQDCEDHVSQMTVNPAPESMRRVFMLFTLYDKEPQGGKYETQILEDFIRTGFTLIEWGGSEKKTCKAFEYETAVK